MEDQNNAKMLGQIHGANKYKNPLWSGYLATGPYKLHTANKVPKPFTALRSSTNMSKPGETLRLSSKGINNLLGTDIVILISRSSLRISRQVRPNLRRGALACTLALPSARRSLRGGWPRFAPARAITKAAAPRFALFEAWGLVPPIAEDSPKGAPTAANFSEAFDKMLDQISEVKSSDQLVIPLARA